MGGAEFSQKWVVERFECGARRACPDLSFPEKGKKGCAGRFRRDLVGLKFFQFLELRDQGDNPRYAFWPPDIPVTVEPRSK